MKHVSFFRFYVALLISFLGNVNSVYSQTNVYNYGTLIYIQKDATVAITGNYEDRVPSSSALLDEPIHLSGTLNIGGDIVNNSGHRAELIYKDPVPSLTGKIVLNGLAVQQINGTSPSFFPNIEIKKTGTVTLNNNVIVDNDLIFTTGNIDLGGRVITLNPTSIIQNETAANYISGAQGWVETTSSTINPNTVVTDYQGIGIGFASGNANFSNAVFYRVHGPNGYQVADGVDILRVYKMHTATTDKFDHVIFHYLDSELNGLSESSLAFYVSNDNGSTWLKVGNTVDATNNTVTAINVPILGNNAENIFALSISTCQTYAPNAVISSTSALINSNLMNICDKKSFQLNVPYVNGNYYVITPPNLKPIVYSDVYTLANIDFSYEGAYQSFVRNPKGCESEYGITVDVRAIPDPAFKITPNPNLVALCYGGQLTFNDISTTSDGTPITSWSWHFNDVNNSTASTQSAQFTYPTTGPQTSTLVVTSQYGCVSNSANKSIVIQTLPVPDFEITDGANIINQICEDSDVYLSNKSSYIDYAGSNSSTLSYTWDFGDGNGSNVTNPVHPYSPYNTYTIVLRTTVDATGCYQNTTKSIQVNPEPVPQFVPMVHGNSVTEACAGVTMIFSNTSTMPGATDMTYSWDFGDGTFSVALNPSKEYVTPGIYTVTLTATSVTFGCFESYSIQITINPPPTGTFTIADTDICIAEDASFTNGSSILSGGLTKHWDFGDGTNSNSSQSALVHSYTRPMQYKVTLTRISDKGCTNSISRNLIVHPSPVASFINSNACDGQSLSFYNNSVIQSDRIESYQWDFGDNATSTSFQPVHIFSTYGSYSVSLKATSDFGCAQLTTKQVTIYRNPTFNLGASIAGFGNTYILNPSVDLNAYLPNGSTYTWYDASKQQIGTSSQVQVNSSGVYSVRIQTPLPESCATTTQLPLFLFRPVDLGQDQASCSQLALDAENGLAGEKLRADQTLYEWRKNGSIISTQQVLILTQTGDYTVTITRTVAGSSCSSSDMIHVDIELPLTVTLPPNITACEGQSLLLDAGVTALSYIWTNLSSGAVVGSQRTATVNASGIYKVEVSNGSCSASTTTTVTFSPLPSVSFGASSSYGCAAQALIFTDYSFADVGNITQSQWDFGDNTNALNQSSVSKQYSASGTYTVTLTAITDNGCQSTYSSDITIRQTPLVNFIAQNVCEGENASIQNNSAANATMLWDFGDQTTSNAFSPIKSFETAGLYPVTLTATLQGCSATATQQVTVSPSPAMEFGSQVTTCGSSIVLDAYNTGSTYRWFNPTTNVTLSTSQQFAVNTDRLVGLDITNVLGCTTSDVADVKLNTPMVVSLGADRPVCDFENLDAGYFPGAQYTWSIGETTRNIKVLTSGVYSVSVVDQNNCAGGASVKLLVSETPIVALGGDKTICESDKLILNAGANTSFAYMWSTGAVTSSMGITHAGTYGVQVSNGICVTNQSVNVTINPSPLADFSSNDVCNGQSTSLINKSIDAGDGALTYQWSLGDGSFSTLVNPIKKYSVSGNYSVKIRATSPTGCFSEITKSILVKPVPTAEFTIANGCTFADVTIGNVSSYPGISALSYQWDFGNNDASNSVNPQYAYKNPGQYVVNLIVSSAEGCSDNYVQQINVGNTPSLANWVTQISSCNSSVLLDASNVGSTYLWSDNSTQQALRAFANGLYDVSITSPDGCSVSAQADVKFKIQVHLVLASAIEGCGYVLIDPKVDAATYLWSTGEQTNTITVVTSNTYSVQVISTDLCIGNASTAVSIHPVPVVALGSDRQACNGETVKLDAASALPVTYLWSTGETTDNINVTSSGSYNLKLTSTFGCTAQGNVGVTFHELPILNFNNNTVTACGNAVLDAGNPGSKYLWSTNSTQQSILATSSGAYSLQVTNAYNCTSSKTIDVSILPLPTLDLGPNLSICNGQTTTLDAGSAGNRYSWSDNSANRYFLVGASGDYKVTITDILGCSSTDQIHVTVRPPLGLDLGQDRFTCNKAGIDISADVDQVIYAWGSNTSFSSQQQEVHIETPGIYWLRIFDSFNCTASDTIRISATTETITASFLIPAVVDAGDVVHFAQLTEPHPLTFSWTFGDGGVSSEENPTHRYFKTGDYQPMLMVSNGVCTDRLTKTITVRNARTQGDPVVLLPQFIDFVEVKLYPNPTSGLVKMEVILTSEAEVLMSIYSLEGILLNEQKKIFKEDAFEFDLTDVSEGMYLIQIITENKTRNIKILKVGRRE